MRSNVSCGISRDFSRLFPTKRQIAHALLTRPPLGSGRLRPEGLRLPYPARLACVRHAASVHPEPGSNSLKKFIQNPSILPGFKFNTYIADCSACEFLRCGLLHSKKISRFFGLVLFPYYSVGMVRSANHFQTKVTAKI